MAIQITNTTVLSTFSLIRAAILANATLSPKFTTNDIYQYEPKHKSRSFRGFPYFLVNIPETDTEKVVFDNNFTEPALSVNILMRVGYEARSNVLNYANAFLKAIEGYESSFQASGYYDVMVTLDDVDSNIVIDSKELVEAVFTIEFHGSVAR